VIDGAILHVRNACAVKRGARATQLARRHSFVAKAGIAQPSRWNFPPAVHTNLREQSKHLILAESQKAMVSGRPSPSSPEVWA
jgi:hypothetical protein